MIELLSHIKENKDLVECLKLVNTPMVLIEKIGPSYIAEYVNLGMVNSLANLVKIELPKQVFILAIKLKKLQKNSRDEILEKIEKGSKYAKELKRIDEIRIETMDYINN